jgi:glycosyltransferase involved in cell wall biosynthesis
MGLPIVCTPKGATALNGAPPLSVAETPEVFADHVVTLWSDDDRRRRIGAEGRAWVSRYHTWEAVAREAMAALAHARRVAAVGGANTP